MTGRHTSFEGAVDSITTEAQPWVRSLARLGYIAKGIVYVVVGIIALQAALSPAGGDPEGTDGALVTIIRQPFGRVLLALMALGLVGYVIWRLVMAFRDPEHRGTDAKGIVIRTGYFISALLHTGLAIAAIRLVMGSGGESGGQEEQANDWTAMVMSQLAGRWIIAAVGAGIILFGLYEIYRAATEDLVKRMRLMSLPFDARKNLERLGRLGLTARGIVFGTIGWFLIQAALQYDPEEARGLAGALETLERQPYGPYLLGVVAIGLFGYGVYQMAKGRYGVIAA